MKEKTFETDCGIIHYWINNSMPGKPSLVFLPGLTADHRLFDKQTDCFCGRFNCFVWDAPGHGASKPFRLKFSLDDKARFLHSILSAENIQDPILVGQSMGGYVSQMFFELYPKEAGGFVSIDSAPLQRKYITAAEIWALRNAEPVYWLYPWKLLQKAGSTGCADSEYGQQLMLDMMQSFTKSDYCRVAGHGFRILADACASDRSYEPKCPVILICGEHDRAGSAKRYNKAWAKETGYPIFWIPNAGHNSNTDQPEMVNQIIENFVCSLDNPQNLVIRR